MWWTSSHSTWSSAARRNSPARRSGPRSRSNARRNSTAARRAASASRSTRGQVRQVHDRQRAGNVRQHHLEQLPPNRTEHRAQGLVPADDLAQAAPPQPRPTGRSGAAPPAGGRPGCQAGAGQQTTGAAARTRPERPAGELRVGRSVPRRLFQFLSDLDHGVSSFAPVRD